MNKKTRYILLTLIILVLISACTPIANKDLQEELNAKNDIITALEKENKELEDKIAELEKEAENPAKLNTNRLLDTSLKVVNLLKNKDMERLSSYVHPTKGVRFSPYGNINVESDMVFLPDEIVNLLSDSKTYVWGNYDGSGEPIELNFNNYYERFVYDVDFASPHMIGNNVVIGKGNTLINISDAYPNAEFIEFHFTGIEPQYEGMDWRSLRLIFVEDNGKYYLIGIAHDEWTI